MVTSQWLREVPGPARNSGRGGDRVLETFRSTEIIDKQRYLPLREVLWGRALRPWPGSPPRPSPARDRLVAARPDRMGANKTETRCHVGIPAQLHGILVDSRRCGDR